MAGSVVNLLMKQSMLWPKRTNCEIDHVCSNSSDTIFEKGFEFSWEKIWDVIEQYLPTLLSLLVSI